MGSMNEWHSLSQHYGRDWASDDHYVATDFNHRPISNNSFAYQVLLSEALGMKNANVLAFKNNSSIPFAPYVHLSFQQYFFAFDTSKPCRYIPQSPERTLDDNDILDDHYLNLLDWGSSNVLSIALGNTVYLWDESNDYVSEFVTVDDENGPVTSIKWAPDGQWIAVSAHGSDQNKLTLWKYPLMLKMADLTGHTSRVLFMAESPNGCSVASAGGDGKLEIWNVIGTPEVAKPAPKANTMPFAHWNHIR